MTKLQRELIAALISQVFDAAKGDNEQTVVTYISRPMWREWNKATDSPVDCEPTGWVGIHETRRVYGSETIVVESDHMWSFSRKR